MTIFFFLFYMKNKTKKSYVSDYVVTFLDHE